MSPPKRCTEPARGQPCKIVQAESEPVLCGFPCTVMIFCISDTLELGCLFITFDMIGPALKIQCQWACRLNGQGAAKGRGRARHGHVLVQEYADPEGSLQVGVID